MRYRCRTQRSVVQRLEPLEHIARAGCEEAAEYLSRFYEAKATQLGTTGSTDWCVA